MTYTQRLMLLKMHKFVQGLTKLMQHDPAFKELRELADEIEKLVDDDQEENGWLV